MEKGERLKVCKRREIGGVTKFLKEIGTIVKCTKWIGEVGTL